MTPTPPLTAWRERLRTCALAAWTGVVGFVTSALLSGAWAATLSSYRDCCYVVLAWMLAACVLPACGGRRGGGPNPSWKLLAWLWAMLDSLAWLGGAYVYNRRGAFYVCLLVVLALLVLCHFWFHLSASGLVAVNTIILLVVGLPVLDLVVRGAGSRRSDIDPHRQYYLYGFAKQHPAAFGRWWNYYIDSGWNCSGKSICPTPIRSWTTTCGPTPRRGWLRAPSPSILLASGDGIFR